MKTLLIVNTGNDGDIIAESLNHNEKFFDKIIIVDRASQDNTISQIESLNNNKISIVKEGFFPAILQPAINQVVLSNTSNEFDFCIILDADEFIVANDLNELKSIKNTEIGLISWRCYVPTKSVYSDFKLNIVNRRTLEPKGCNKIVLPKYTESNLVLGNHYAHDIFGTRIQHIELKTIFIAHFPVRSIEQYNKKIKFFNNINLNGLSNKQLIHLINIPEIKTIEELKERAINYVAKIDGQTLIYDPVL